MCGVALCLRRLGYAVSGSDMNDGAALQRLREAGVTIHIGHNGGNIPAETQLVVASAAVKDDNPEAMAARARDIPRIKYAKMLGLLMNSRRGIAVAGTHGKTTTTGMLALALTELQADPSFVVGGEVPQLGGSSGVGDSDILVAEACEYDRSFLNLSPKYALISNIEEDHLDYYKDLDEIIQTFREFALRIPEDGLLVYSGSSSNIAHFIDDVPCRAVSCALEHEANYVASGIRFENGRSLYRLTAKPTAREIGDPHVKPDSCDVSLATFGRHNVINSLLAIALLHQMDYPLAEAAQAVGKFTGARRRFETVYDEKNITIVDDYAHHPTEIQTVLRSSRTYFDTRRIISVFQPHQHSRTRFLMKDFARSFQHADLVIVPDIYFVRDTAEEREMVHARDLVRQIIAAGGNAIYIPSFSEIEQFLINNVHPGDVVLTMGAGNVWEIGAELAKHI